MKWLSWIRNKFFIAHCFYSDYKSALDSRSPKYVKENLQCQMLLISHSLEKGMSFVNKKKDWGKEKAYSLCNILNRYLSMEITGDDCSILSINVLNSYLQDPFASKDKTLVESICRLKEKYPFLIKDESTGLKTIMEPPSFNAKLIKEFFNTRNSVRYFSDVPITDDEIKQAAKFASCTPTACNRQSSRIYGFRDKSTIKAILTNQMGDQGWCNNAQALFVITGIRSYFSLTYERQQVYIDGGLFAMNFDYGLHLQHIASCFKMFVREPKQEKEFKEITGIPENETPIVLILAGHYKDNSIQSPKSHRFDVRIQVDGNLV